MLLVLLFLAMTVVDGVTVVEYLFQFVMVLGMVVVHVLLMVVVEVGWC